jgi:hypothetical protein
MLSDVGQHSLRDREGPKLRRALRVTQDLQSDCGPLHDFGVSSAFRKPPLLQCLHAGCSSILPPCSTGKSTENINGYTQHAIRMSCFCARTHLGDVLLSPCAQVRQTSLRQTQSLAILEGPAGIRSVAPPKENTPWACAQHEGSDF